MKNKIKNLNIIFFSFILIFLVSCFNVERNNIFDPQSSNYEGNSKCAELCPHLWTVIDDMDRCFMQGDTEPCDLNYDRFIPGCINLCSFGDDYVGAWSDDTIECAMNITQPEEFPPCLSYTGNNNPPVNSPAYPNSDIFFHYNDSPIYSFDFGSFAPNSFDNPGAEIWIRNESGNSITFNSITSNEENAFSVNNISDFLSNYASESFNIIFNTQNLSNGYYSTQIIVDFHHNGDQNNYSITLDVSGNIQ